MKPVNNGYTIDSIKEVLAPDIKLWLKVMLTLHWTLAEFWMHNQLSKRKHKKRGGEMEQTQKFEHTE